MIDISYKEVVAAMDMLLESVSLAVKLLVRTLEFLEGVCDAGVVTGYNLSSEGSAKWSQHVSLSHTTGIIDPQTVCGRMVAA